MLIAVADIKPTDRRNLQPSDCSGSSHGSFRSAPAGIRHM